MNCDVLEMILNNEILSNLKINGIVKLPNFLSNNNLKIFKNYISKVKPKKSSPESYISKSNNELFYKLLKFEFNKFYKHFCILNFSKEMQMKSISEKYFEKKSYLSMIDGYWSDRNSFNNKTIIPWHTDMAHSGQADVSKIKHFPHPDDISLKFFIYLTDVYTDNGCMSYIPGSHEITRLIRKGIYEKKIEYSPYHKISEIKNFLNRAENEKYIRCLLNKENDLDNFLKKINQLDDLISSKEYDYKMNSGDAIIFDEGIIHRGSKLLYSDRMVLRYIYRPYIKSNV